MSRALPARVRDNAAVRADLRTLLLTVGASEDDVDRAEREGWLPLLTLDALVLPGPPTYDVAAMAAMTGVDDERLRRLWRAVGFPDVPDGLVVFTDADVEAARRLLDSTLARGSDFETLLRQVRVIGASMARIAAVVAEHYAEMVQEQRAGGLEDEDIAASLVETFDAEELASLIVYSAAIHLRAALWLRFARDAAPDLLVAIGFADLAGYTVLSAELDSEGLGDLVGRWEELVYDTVAAHGARVVKTIGDEAMFVGLSSAVARIAVELRDAAAAHGLPPVRTGLAAGMVVARDGVFYGPVVNLASRLTEVAPPGEIYASEAMHDQLAADPSFTWSVAGPLDLRSIGSVPVFSLRARDEGVAG
ncbi:MAG: adenylate cyclase [Actinomycetota bacterium]|nr:adenylate cyclase [Actinomycetota bacterium]